MFFSVKSTYIFLSGQNKNTFMNDIVNVTSPTYFTYNQDKCSEKTKSFGKVHFKVLFRT